MRVYTCDCVAVCGGVKRSVTAGMVAVSQYPNNSNCTWTLQVQEGRTIRLSFQSMSIAGSGAQGNCEDDYVEVEY